MDLEEVGTGFIPGIYKWETIYQVLKLLRQQIYEVDMVRIAPIISSFIQVLLNKARDT